MNGELSKKEIGYLAGFLDADGSIAIHTCNEYLSSRIVFTNTDYSIVKHIKELLEKEGISVNINAYGGSEKHKEEYRIEIHAQKDTTHLLRLTKNLLAGKKPQAELALKFLRLKSLLGRTPPNTFQKERLEKYYEQMKELNKRGK